MTSLNKYGWNSFHQTNFTACNNPDLTPGRVVSIKGFKYYVVFEGGELETELSGKLLYGTDAEDLPKVGDWVLFRNYDALGYLIEILPRFNAVSRKISGKQNDRQILASNVDLALIVQGLDQDFNVMRLQRYLVQLASCHVNALVVLNKADLVTDRQAFVNEVQRLKHECTVIFCSALSGEGFDELTGSMLKPAKTCVLVGSSGVGKSSLLNMLMGGKIQKTSGVSDSSSKGKHTTTSRELFVLPNGSLMIDTPGMREFGLTMEEGIQEDVLFPAIHSFSASCRFGDCGHTHEAGCAVLAALQSGELDNDIYNSYIKLLKEQRHFEIRAEDKKRLGRQAGKMSRQANENRKKNKF